LVRALFFFFVVVFAGFVAGGQAPVAASDRACAGGGAAVACGARVMARQQDDAAAELATKHRPVVYTKQQDESCSHKGEVYYPIAVETVLGNEATTFYDADGDAVTTAPTAADLFEKEDGYYLDFPGNPKKAGCDYEQAFEAFQPPPDPVVYAHVFHEEGDDDLVVQYWLYFYFNDWNNNHESDWEFIQLVFDVATAEEALETEPDRVIYSQHGGGEQPDWVSSKVKKEDDRPVIYVASGSHAIQFTAERFLGKGESGTGFGCDDASGPSVRHDPESRLIPNDVSGADDPFAWITYEGRWGEKQSGEFNGPTGPNTKTPWREPITWMEKQRDSSVEVPEDTIGPNAAGAFCGIVSFGSELLFARGVWAVLALIALVVGSVSVTAFRTDFRPALPEPLRLRRHFGQIVTSAFRIERRHAALFLGIGALFLPIGVVTSALQRIVLSLPPVEGVIEVLDDSVASALIALGIGALQFGVTYWLVLCASIAAVDALDRGRRSDIIDAYKSVWWNLKQLVTARLRSLLIIVGLSITVVGLPFAVIYGVRWLFLEQAILIDDANAGEARKRSGSLVHGDFWRTFGASAAVAIVATLAGPIIGVMLVLLTSQSLVFINTLSSILYLALVPFAGIALTLLYYDRVLAMANDAGASDGTVGDDG
jgi:hypothetical protein